MQNGYVESFNGRMHDALLNESLFFGLDHARSAIAEWRMAGLQTLRHWLGATFQFALQSHQEARS
ncbi:hypothetical protein MES5069_480043 [Mesorhizobium escarrei]|uniref:Integrase catalytic domain-containing protein n=1 Tax=Mesorhizobium escarrei TaxID=666018 RepID=A0ABM9E905_9HYPH|nr:hypothetical protein MES5069_480043 [Mesorhizobium escarrei]